MLAIKVQTFRNTWQLLRSSFWFVPGVLAIVAIFLSIALGKADEELGATFAGKVGWIYSGGPEGARGVLSAIAGSVMGVAGTTFSITIAVLSLTSGQFGPRLLRNFMRDFGNQVVLGTFTATFLYCILVLRTIRGTDRVVYVPHVSVTVGVLLAVLSVGVLIYFVNHVAESIQVSRLIETVAKDADGVIRRLFPEASETGAEDPRTLAIPSSAASEVHSKVSGYIETIDRESVVALASSHGLFVRFEVRPGQFIVPGMNLASVWPQRNDLDDQLRNAVSCGRDRTTLQDIEFSFLQFAEMAVRALSSGINDPFTAMMCIDRITETMCGILEREWLVGWAYDDRGEARVVWRTVRPEELVDAAFGHIRHAARASPAVIEKLRDSLTLLLDRATDHPLRTSFKAEIGKLPARSTALVASGAHA